MKKSLRILIVDDEKEILKSLSRILESAGYQTYIAQNFSQALEVLKVNRVDLVLSDLVMENKNGLDLLKEIRSNFPYLKVIMMTAYGTIDSSIEAIKNGAFGYILKPFNIEELLNEIDKVQKITELEKENSQLKKLAVAKFISYESSNLKMKKILTLISKKIALSESTILLSGESGTGKEIIAAYIHNLSHRAKGPFIRVSCAALSEGVLESELFGHVKGAFTGAIKDKKGRFEAASSGTIFLDEIGDISANIQLKLLRVLQEKVVERVGQNEQLKVDVRIIAATNKNLEQLVKEGKFREDLYYRINVINIELPALRERKEDIAMLIENFIKKYSIINNIYISHIEESAIVKLMNYQWPGNIRELENVIERAVVLSENGIISEHFLPEHILRVEENKITPLKIARESFEREYILSILETNNNNIAKTAADLNISRKNLYEKLKKLAIKY